MTLTHRPKERRARRRAYCELSRRPRRRTDDHRRRRHLSGADLQEVVQRLPRRESDSLFQLSGEGVRHRDCAVQGRNGILRRHRCAHDERRSGRSAAYAARSDRRGRRRARLQRAWTRSRPEAIGRRDRRYIREEDRPLERSANCAREHRRAAAGDPDRRRASRRQLRHDVCLYQLPVRGQPELEVRPGRQQVGQLAHW